MEATEQKLITNFRKTIAKKFNLELPMSCTFITCNIIKSSLGCRKSWTNVIYTILPLRRSINLSFSPHCFLIGERKDMKIPPPCSIDSRLWLLIIMVLTHKNSFGHIWKLKINSLQLQAMANKAWFTHAAE